MIVPATTRVWRYGSVLLFCGLPLLLLGLAVFDLIDASEARDDAARQQATLSQIVAQLARHRPRTPTPAETASLYLASTSASLARAELQDRAIKLVARTGGTLAEAQIVSTPEQENDGAVAIQLTLTIGNEGLRDLLYGVEAGLPLLDVTDLSVDWDDQSNEAVTTDERPGGARMLHVELTVRGHWKRAGE